MSRVAVFIIILIASVSMTRTSDAAKKTSEHLDRLVDAAAVSAQEQAIEKLKGLLKKHKGSSREVVILERLGDTYFQAASFYFRMSHGSTSRRAQAQQSYRAALQNTIEQNNQLISQFPDYPMIYKIYFQRAKSWEELGNKAFSKRDYLHLLKHYPDSDESIAAAMSLADQSISDNQHEEALTYLAHVEKVPEHSLYPFALYKSAWSHYNLKHLPVAVDYLEKHISFLHEKLKIQSVMSSSDESFLQNSLQDLVMFYLSRYENLSDPYPVEEIYDYFKKISRGKFLSNMSVRTAKLIRAHSRDAELLQWRDIVQKEDLGKSEIAEIHLIVLEHLWNGRKHELLLSAATQWKLWAAQNPGIDQTDTLKKSILFLAELGKNYQELTIKNKNHPKAHQFAEVMKTVYGVIEDTLDKNDPQTAITRFNMAETYFAIQDYVAATENYRWIVDRFKKHPSLNLEEIKLRSVAARYEDLKIKKIIPTELKVSPKPSADPSVLNPQVEEWIAWIESISPQDEKTMTFVFEANRTLYSEGQILRAIGRMEKFVNEHPETKEAVAACSLVVDTYVASADWEQVHTFARHSLSLKGWTNADHLKNLKKFTAQAWLKLIEADFEKDRFESAIAREAKLREWYNESEFYSDSLLWLAKSNMKLKKSEDAHRLFNELVQHKLSPVQKQYVLSGRAEVFEKNRAYLEAARDYWQLYGQTGKIEFYKKAIEYFWIEGQLKEVGGIQNLQKCQDKSDEFCHLFSALYALETHAEPTADIPGLQALHTVRAGNAKTLWDHMNQLRKLAKKWESVPPQVQYALLPVLIDVSKKEFEKARRHVQNFEKLKASAQYLQNRVDNILRFEQLVQAWADMPWTLVRLPALDHLAGAYEDFSSELKLLKVSGSDRAEIKTLTESLDEKSKQMRMQIDALESVDLKLDPSIDLLQKAWAVRVKDEPFSKAYLQALQEKKFAKATFLLSSLSGEPKEWGELLLWWHAGAQFEARDRILKIALELKGKPLAQVNVQ